ncbi:MAG: endonuclease/exonuclease/phosphatase family protein [Treponema sp.]|jgi:endonuclease/exonuclease/phosphatase family metal-dependent hydrolase|nr:endonuclease/exonuclease/phosphatase family protein [Treponema sp.]
MKGLFLIAKITIILILVAAGGFASLLAYLTITEYRPKPVEAVEIAGSAKRSASRYVQAGVPLKIVAWNIGYGALDASEDFFMDGGKTVRSPKARVEENIKGVREFIVQSAADIILLQEVDVRSHRSYYIDEAAYLAEKWIGSTTFAPNFLTTFVPFPFPECIGAVKSGVLTMNAFISTEASRIALPVPFKWPVRVANLKRCLLVERLPVAGGGELVLVNLHLEAYSSGEGRMAQMNLLIDFLKVEYAKGNYCIAGGDFNQTFPGVDERVFRVKNTEHFVPGILSPDMLPAGWRFATGAGTPSSRLLNEPYSGDPETTQLYVIDGYILSPNTELTSVNTVDAGFRYSDHNPVSLEVVLRRE